MASAPVAIESAPPRRRPSLLARRNVPIYLGLGVLVGFVVAGLFAPLPYDPVAPDPDAILQGPSSEHWFGTDISGFDVFSRVIEAASRDIPLAFGGTLVSLLIGVPLGLLASNKGKSGERIMRALDVFQSFPLLVLAIAIVALAGNTIDKVIWAIAITNVPRFMRLVRSEALSIRESRFIEAATAIGATRKRIMFKHMLPNVSGVILVQFSLAAAYAIVVIAALNFIGVGVNPPDPTWGSMIKSGVQNITNGEWWVSVFPGLAIFLAVASLNVIADAVEARTEKW